MLFPIDRREQVGICRWVAGDALEHIDEIGSGVDVVEPTRLQQTVQRTRLTRFEQLRAQGR